MTSLADAVLQTARRWREPDHPTREEATLRTLDCGNRFTAEATIFAVNQQLGSMSRRAIDRWTGGFSAGAARRVGVFNPGNIPFAGFQDFLAVVLTDHHYLGKLSSRSPFLLPAFAAEIRDLFPDLPAHFEAADSVLAQSDALVLTGSDDSVDRLRERAAGAGIPASQMLIRGHRYSAAVIGRREPSSALERLAEDLLLHDGLGCRSPAVVWAPRGESPDPLLAAMARFRAVFPAHPKTVGTLKMQAAYHSAVGAPTAYAEDGSFLVTRGDPEPQEPGHIRWSEYTVLEDVTRWIEERVDELQLVSAANSVRSLLSKGPVPVVEAGMAQRPELGWRQDGKDIISFLKSLA